MVGRQAGDRVALACAAAALTIAALAAAFTVSALDGRTSTLVHLAGDEPLAALALAADPTFAVVNRGAHYDGVYFYAIALDPFAQGAAHKLIDRAAYRYGHPGYGWAAAIVSAGQALLVPLGLLGIGLGSVALAAWAAALISRELGWSPWGGLTVALNPGLIYAVTVDTSESLGVAVLALGLLAWLRGRTAWAGLLLGFLCLVKEPYVLVPMGLALWQGVQWARGRQAPGLGARLTLLAGGPVALGLWFTYIRAQLGIWPFADSPESLRVPFSGWIETLRIAAALGIDTYDRMQVGQAEIPLILVVGGGLVLGITRAVRLRTPLDPIFLLLALAECFFFGWLELLYPKDLIRLTAVSLALLPAAIAGWGPNASSAFPNQQVGASDGRPRGQISANRPAVGPRRRR